MQTRKQDSPIPSRLRITVRGELSPRLVRAFDGFSAHHHSGRTDLEGDITDQAQLHGLLSRVRDLGLELENVTISRPPKAPGA